VLNTEFCVAVGKGFKAISQEAAESNLTVKSYTTGDANGDSRVNVTDIVEIVNYIMGNPSERFVFPAADVNDDGDVNVTDIVGVINIIMSDKSYAPSVSGRRAAEVLDLAQYTAAQFEVKVTDGTTVDKIRLVESMEQTHQLMYQKKDANTYMVLVYSLSNELMQPENGEIIEIECDSDAAIVENVMVVTPTGDTAYYETMPATTGIRPIENENTPAVIYNLKGNRIDNAKEKGVYIINNKKYIAK
jgi:TusA-related sulfurtransferase